MAQLARAAARPLWKLPLILPVLPSKWPFHRLLFVGIKTSNVHHLHPSIVLPVSHRNVHIRSRGLRKPGTVTADPNNEQLGSETDSEKSRNEKKQEARRAVRWGMSLSSFSNPQIKRILKAAGLEQEVYEAIMVVKRFGPDVREGKRRQFNYIGKLIRDAKPDLLGGLIQATKDGDHSALQALCDSKDLVVEVDEEEEVYKSETEEEDEEDENYNSLVSRWYTGLTNKDIDISSEVYSIREVEFDRQELCKRVRKVHSILERKDSVEVENEGKLNAELTAAERSLTSFLRFLAKQMPTGVTG